VPEEGEEETIDSVMVETVPQRLEKKARGREKLGDADVENA
jgi:hypothetical protein